MGKSPWIVLLDVLLSLIFRFRQVTSATTNKTATDESSKYKPIQQLPYTSEKLVIVNIDILININRYH